MGFRCARCGTYVGDDEQYWYNDYGYFCSERCAAFVREQREREDEDREAAAEAAAAQTRAAERAAESAAAQTRLAQRAAEAAEEQLEVAREAAEREAKHREHEAMLAKCINIGGAYYSADKTTLVELDKNVRELTVQEGTKFIKEYSCYERDQLKSVTFPDSLEEIEEAAFSHCSALTSVTFAQNGNLKKIGKWAFSCAGVIEIDIPEGVEEIGETAFISCTALKRLNIPKSVKKYGKWAFNKCTALTDVTIADGSTVIGDSMFHTCTALKSVTIPASVSEIEECAFYKCSALASVTIPASVKKMGKGAFAECGALKSVTIADGVTEIAQSAFSKCTSLASIAIPASVKNIGEWAFWGCTALKSVTFADGCTVVGENMFTDCTSLKSITIPDGVTEILDDTFRGCTALSSVSCKGTLKKIGERAFKNCTALTKVDDLLAHVEVVGGGAFQNTGITEVTIPAKVKTGSYDEEINGEEYTRGVFACCEKLTKVTVTEGIKELGDALFRGCKNLKSVTLPNSLKKIRWGAFRECSSLESVEIPSGVEFIGGSAFSECEKLASVKIPSNISAIENSTFWGCKNLTSVTFPSSVKSIGKYAFSYCDSLTSVSIPNSVKEIGKDAFRECNSLVSVSVPRGIKEIDAFYGCKRLRRLPIGGGRTESNSKYEPHTPVEKLLYKLWGTKKAKKRAIIILACLALVFLIKYAMGGEARFAKKAQKNFDSWYTSAADIIVGQTFTYNRVDSSSGEISVKTRVPFAKDGFAYGNELYTVDTATRSVKSETRDGDKHHYAYFPDGSAYYGFNNDGSVGFVYPKEGAQFNAAQATEVIGKTFSGKWSDGFTASITFGADGKATVKFSDGDNGSGAYIASDEDNIVLYNHRDNGVWHKFVYSDDSDDVTFKRYYAKKLRNGRFDTSVSTDTHDDWKRK